MSQCFFCPYIESQWGPHCHLNCALFKSKCVHFFIHWNSSPSLLLSINSGKHPVAGQLGGSLSKLFLQPNIHCLGKQPVHKDASPPSHLHVHLPKQHNPIFHLLQRGLLFPESWREGKSQAPGSPESRAPESHWWRWKQLFKSEFSRWRCVQSFFTHVGSIRVVYDHVTGL